MDISLDERVIINNIVLSSYHDNYKKFEINKIKSENIEMYMDKIKHNLINGSYFKKYARNNDNIKLDMASNYKLAADQASNFNCEKPSISIGEYIKRISCGLEDCILIVAIHYLKKLNDKYDILNEKTIHKLFMTAFLISYKFLQDEPIGHDFFSRKIGLSNNAVVSLEKNFLELIDYDLCIEYQDYLDIICSF